MEPKSLMAVGAVALAWLLWGLEVGKWGLRDTFTRPRGATWRPILLMLFAMSLFNSLSQGTRDALGYSALVFPITAVVSRARQYGTWNIVGLDMGKMCHIRDLGTQRLLTGGGSASLLSELLRMLEAEDDWRVRRCIYNALAGRPSVMALPYLQQGVDDDHPAVQVEALKGLGYSALTLLQMRQIDKARLDALTSQLEAKKGAANLDGSVVYQLSRTLQLLTSLRRS